MALTGTSSGTTSRAKLGTSGSGTVTVATGNVKPFFYGLAVFCLFNLFLNWYFYGRKGAEKPS